MTTSGTDGGRNPGVRNSEDAEMVSIFARQREIQTRKGRNEHDRDAILCESDDLRLHPCTCTFMYKLMSHDYHTLGLPRVIQSGPRFNKGHLASLRVLISAIVALGLTYSSSVLH